MDFLRNFNLTDFLDIAVISFLIYVALFWFRQTSARFVILGILILSIVYVAAKYLGLYITTAIFQAFFAVFFIAVVIIFQEELRHFFEQIALWGTWRGRRKLGSFHTIVEVIVRTVADLSQKRIGALIVLRGQDPLDRHLEGGVSLSGMPSESLLASIFDPHSSGHDGAVIIENNLVDKFGCHLPLSKDLRQIAQYGTRHTAALGLAERCDAICVVVSEERGSIVIAREGKLHPINSLTQLNALLEKFYNEKFPLRRGAMRSSWWTSNLKEKFLALVLACVIWAIFGQKTEIIRRDYSLPIEYRNLSPTLVLEEPKPSEVVVTLSGLERAFDIVEPRSLKVSLDMVNIEPGEQTVIVTRQDVRLPANLNLERIEPSLLRLNISQLVELTVPVEVQTTGAVPSPYLIEKLTVSPQEIKVIANPSAVKEQRIKIFTENINLSEIKETVTLTPRLIVPTELRFYNGKAPVVKVSIQVKKGQENIPAPSKEEEILMEKGSEELQPIHVQTNGKQKSGP